MLSPGACHLFYVAFKKDLFRDFPVIDRTVLKETLKKLGDIMIKFLFFFLALSVAVIPSGINASGKRLQCRKHFASFSTR